MAARVAEITKESQTSFSLVAGLKEEVSVKTEDVKKQIFVARKATEKKKQADQQVSVLNQEAIVFKTNIKDKENVIIRLNKKVTRLVSQKEKLMSQLTTLGVEIDDVSEFCGTIGDEEARPSTKDMNNLDLPADSHRSGRSPRKSSNRGGGDSSTLIGEKANGVTRKNTKGATGKTTAGGAGGAGGAAGLGGAAGGVGGAAGRGQGSNPNFGERKNN